MSAPWKEEKYITPENLEETANKLRSQGKTLATLNGLLIFFMLGT